LFVLFGWSSVHRTLSLVIGFARRFLFLFLCFPFFADFFEF
jgi:hypothetical protein